MEVRTTPVCDADEHAAEVARADLCWNNAVLRRLAGNDVVGVWAEDMLSSWRAVGLSTPQVTATVDDVRDDGRNDAMLAYLPPMILLFGSPGTASLPDAAGRLADCTVGEAALVRQAMDFAAGGFGRAEDDDPCVLTTNGWPSVPVVRALLRHLADGVVAAASRQQPLRGVAGLDDSRRLAAADPGHARGRIRAGVPLPGGVLRRPPREDRTHAEEVA